MYSWEHLKHLHEIFTPRISSTQAFAKVAYLLMAAIAVKLITQGVMDIITQASQTTG